MYLIITTENKEECILNAVNEEPAFIEAGPFDSIGIRSLFRKLQRSPGDILIIDLDSGLGEDIVTGVRDFRIKRPETRIIIIGAGREPGDKTIAQLISLGVYDLIILEKTETDDYSKLTELLTDKLKSPPGVYADVARWHVIESINNSENKEVVFRDKLVGTVYITAGAASPGMGATTTAISLAAFLTKIKFKVAVIELIDNEFRSIKSFEFLKEFYKTKPGYNKNSFTLAGIDFYSGNLKDILSAGKKYDYVIIDAGPLKIHTNVGPKESPFLEEMGRADVSILTSGNSIFRLRKDLTYFFDLMKDWKIVFLPGYDQDVEEFKEEFLGKKEFLNIPEIYNPFNLSDEAKNFFKALLKEVLPQEVKENKKRFFFWKR